MWQGLLVDEHEGRKLYEWREQRSDGEVLHRGWHWAEDDLYLAVHGADGDQMLPADICGVAIGTLQRLR
jgi:hypothetical protein